MGAAAFGRQRPPHRQVTLATAPSLRRHRPLVPCPPRLLLGRRFQQTDPLPAASTPRLRTPSCRTPSQRRPCGPSAPPPWRRRPPRATAREGAGAPSPRPPAAGASAAPADASPPPPSTPPSPSTNVAAHSHDGATPATLPNCGSPLNATSSKRPLGRRSRPAGHHPGRHQLRCTAASTPQGGVPGCPPKHLFSQTTRTVGAIGSGFGPSGSGETSPPRR